MLLYYYISIYHIMVFFSNMFFLSLLPQDSVLVKKSAMTTPLAPSKWDNATRPGRCCPPTITNIGSFLWWNKKTLPKPIGNPQLS